MRSAHASQWSPYNFYLPKPMIFAVSTQGSLRFREYLSVVLQHFWDSRASDIRTSTGESFSLRHLHLNGL